ncbi:MAG: hypothetical protein POELPBGB_00247 [Bacteroidia bacterium]|nr:hypothetical protein [Bacteroidia bacterium]
MKKHSKEEIANLIVLGRGRHTWVHVALKTLQVGEGITIEKGKDWISKTPPYQLVSRFGKKHNCKFETKQTIDRTGWVVIRVK